MKFDHKQLQWNADGLIPVIAQDYVSGKVLMLAWMNQDALEESTKTGMAVYWSRSRKRLWRKGETSGHVQHIKGIRLDCDQDALLLQVEQVAGIACHTGRESCFYRLWQDGVWIEVDPVLKSPKEMYPESK